MDDSRFHDLIDLIYEKKDAFNSAEYLMLMNLLAKAFKITTTHKETILNTIGILMIKIVMMIIMKMIILIMIHI